MKRRETTLAILAALSASIALADDFKTIDGKEYKNVTVSRVEPDGIVLKSKSGITKLYFSELPKEVQERFHYDSAQAADFTAAQQAAVAQQNAALRQQEEQQRAEAVKKNAEAIKKNMRTVREVVSDQPNFLDQSFLLEGSIEVSNYYNWGYQEAEQTHYSFKVVDSTGNHCAVYMERERAAKLRQQLIDAGGPLKGVFTVVLLGDRYRKSNIPPSELTLELLDYHLGE